MPERSLGILLVEDNEIDAAVIKAMLEAEYSVSISCNLAKSIDEAVALVRARSYDCALLDLHLGEVNGADALAILREICPSLPVVILTSQDSYQIANKLLGAGAQDYLVKGRVEADALFRAIGYAIERQRSNLALSAALTAKSVAMSALERSEQHRRLIFDTVKEALIFYGSDGKVLEANPAATAMLGFDRADAAAGDSGQNALELAWLREDGTEIPHGERPAEIALATGSSYEEVIGIRHGHTETSWFLVRAEPLRDEDVLCGVVLSLTDVTQNLRHQHELSRSERRYRQLSDLSPDAIIATAADGSIMHANDSAARLLGLAGPGDLRGRQMLDFAAAFSRAANFRRRQSVLAGETVKVSSETFRKLDGELRNVEISSAPFDLDGRPAVLSVVRDVTDRDLAIERHRVTLDASPVGLGLVGTSGQWLQTNDALCRITGHTAEELFAKQFSDLSITEDREIGVAEFNRLIAGEIDRWQVRKRFRRTDDKVIWLQIDAGVVLDVQGNPAGCVMFFQDITTDIEAHGVLATAEEQQRAIITAIAEAVVLHDIAADGEVIPIFSNAATTELLGLDTKDLQAIRRDNTNYETLSEDGRLLDPTELPASVTARTGRPVDGFIFGRRHPGGHIVWYRASSRLVEAPSGRRQVISSISDFTPVKQAHEKLMAAHARFAALVEHGTDVITVVQRDGSLSYASPSYERLLGAVPDRRIGQSVFNLVHPDDRDRVADVQRRVIAEQGAVITCECRMSHADGTWRHVEVTAVNRLDDPAVNGIVSTTRDITDRVLVAERLAHQATHDPLTGLANRLILLDHLTSALARAERSGAPTAVFYLDLDGFKKINDSLGHAAGDELLVAVAERLRYAMRPSDTVARLGGDEFVVVAEGVTELSTAIEIAERIKSAISEPVDLSSCSVSIKASVGIARSAQHRAEALLQEADTALYRAKENGRGRWEIYDHAMLVIAQRRLDTENQIRDALGHDRLVAAYQPIVRLGDGDVVGYEALARLRTGYGQVLGADEFIPVAEESGLIVPLGAAILDQACAKAAALVRVGKPGHVSINVAARQLADPNLADSIAAALEVHGIPANCLCVEVTENALMNAGVSTRKILSQVAELGVSIALDDFGTGGSSLTFLRRYPIDIIKIDRGFVSGLGVNNDDTEVVKAVIGVGLALGHTIVAEGVETEAQASALRLLGCQLAQGYLFGRPELA